MEWVETTARTVEEAKELALDQLGVVADEAEFNVLAEPKQGLFGRLRGEARVRARVRPAPVRPKQERRRGRKGAPAAASAESNGERDADAAPSEPGAEPSEPAPTRGRGGRRSRAERPTPAADEPNGERTTTDSPGGTDMTTDEHPTDAEPVVSEADVESVRVAAVDFVEGLTTAFGLTTTVDSAVDGNEIDVRVGGSSLGLLIGPGGRTLLAIQDLARVAAQRRLGDHDTRLRIDVAGYREKRREAL